MEAQVQNVTLGPLCLEKVCLEPSQLFHVSSLNAVDRDDDSEGDGYDSDGFDDDDDQDGGVKKTSVFGKVNCIQPQVSKNEIFR